MTDEINLNCSENPADTLSVRSYTNIKTILFSAKEAGTTRSIALKHDNTLELIAFLSAEAVKHGWLPKPTEAKPEAAPRARPKGSQEYKGNGKHDWEPVSTGTARLRVPGGWLYHTMDGTVFVPVPEVVGYAV